MKINLKIFKAYDIRGVYPTDINEENFVDIVKAIYTFFVEDIGKENLKVILSRDMRVSSPSLFNIAKKTLIDMGAEVGNVGLVSTPTFYFSILHHKFDCGIQVSASHNPKEYNGIKFAKRVNKSLIKIGKSTGMDKVRNFANNKKFYKSEIKGKLVSISNTVSEEVNFAFKLVKPKNLKKLKVVADPANAMAITYLEELFKKTPCELIKMNFTLDGTFPAHQPDPLDFNNLKDLQRRVIKEKADFGIAPDGDGDRVFFIDEKGKVIPASLITSVLVNHILQGKPKEKVVIDVRYTQNISNVVKKMKGIPVIWKIGHALITEKMNLENAIFSGEGSGHYFYRATGFAESSVLTILLLLEILGKTNKPISKVVNQFHSSYESGEFNFIFDHEIDIDKLKKYFSNEYKNGQITYIDGIAVDFSNWRFNIRPSNTEPLIRLNVESDSSKLTKDKLKELSEKIIMLGGSPK